MLTALLIVAVLVELVLIFILHEKIKDHEERLTWHQEVIRRLPPEIKNEYSGGIWHEVQQQFLASQRDRDPRAVIEIYRRQAEELKRLSDDIRHPGLREALAARRKFSSIDQGDGSDGS